MKQFEQTAALREHLKALRLQQKSIAFVPTMGNLHQGHLSLVNLAQQRADIVVVSIYVNPMQFGPNEDFDAYPRTLVNDLKQLGAAGVDSVFTPKDSVMYPNGRQHQTYVDVPELTDILCGKERPGHFRGVTTVVSKLFNMVQPDYAIFGEKDYQQLQVIKKMVSDLDMNIDIIGAPIARTENGLALSSRNQYLTDPQKQSAQTFNQVLQQCKQSIKNGDEYRHVETQAVQSLEQQGFKVDYLEIRHAEGLQLAHNNDGVDRLRVLAAAFYGKPRLLDNIAVNL